MRLTKEQRERAKTALLGILLDGPRTTAELQQASVGRGFYGERTLSLLQVRTFLRETEKVLCRFQGQGMYGGLLWWLKEEAVM